MAKRPLQASQWRTVATWHFAAPAALVGHRTDPLLCARSRTLPLPRARLSAHHRPEGLGSATAAALLRPLANRGKSPGGEGYAGYRAGAVAFGRLRATPTG